jgi:hypothetical protein
MKKIWITSLDPADRAGKHVQTVLGTIRAYGLDGNGHFWIDDLKNMAWLGPREQLVEKDTALWLILGSRTSLEAASVRYGLGLLALTVQAARGYGFPVLVLDTEGGLESVNMPGPLRGAEIIPVASPTLGAKLAARAGMPAVTMRTDYRIDIHANTAIGLWFEVGPAEGGEWSGAMLGVCGGAVDFHGVGEAGRLPHRAVLEYPIQGLKLTLGEKEYTAWAVQNRLDGNSSYYVRVADVPQSIVFGPFAPEDDAGVYVIEF